MSDEYKPPALHYFLTITDDSTGETVMESITVSRGGFMKACFESSIMITRYLKSKEQEEHDRLQKITQESIVKLEEARAEKPLPPPVAYGDGTQPLPVEEESQKEADRIDDNAREMLVHRTQAHYVNQDKESSPPSQTQEERIAAKRKELSGITPRELPPQPEDVTDQVPGINEETQEKETPPDEVDPNGDIPF